MPSKHQLQVLPLTLCVLFCQHLWLRWMLILERYSSSPLLLLSQWRWGGCWSRSHPWLGLLQAAARNGAVLGWYRAEGAVCSRSWQLVLQNTP